MTYTEDDTFEALRRIPQSQVREKLGEYGIWFGDHREQYYAAIAYNKRMKKWNMLKRLVGLATYHSNPSDLLIKEDIEEKLTGTGWTVESYTVEIDKPILESRAIVYNIKMKRRFYLLCAVPLMLALGVQIAVAVGVVWTQGLILGLQLCNLITFTYSWVTDKFWPYPDHYYRYE